MSYIASENYLCGFLCMLPRWIVAWEGEKMKKKPSLKAIAVLFIICAAFAVGYTAYSANARKNAGQETAADTTVQEISSDRP